MHQRDEAGHVTEPKAGDQTRLQRELLPQPKSVAQPDQVGGAGELVVDAVQAAVGRNHAVTQNLAQPHHLECRRATLRVTGQALLRHHEQWCTGGASQRIGQPFVQLGLVRVVGQRRGVVLGHHRDVVGADAELGERARQLGILAAATGGQRAKPWSRDRRVHTVAEGRHVRHHCQHRKTHLDRKVAAGQQDGAAALSLDEPEPTAVVGAGELRVADALGPHRRGVGGRGHVTEADDGLQRQVVVTACHHELCLAQPDLVHALLDRNRRGSARADRVDHRAVAADIGLNHMSGNDIRQDFLKDVVRLVPAEQVAVVHGLHRCHSTHAGALRAGHQAGVHPAHQLRRGEARGQERVDGRDEIPDRQPVDRVRHLLADAVHHRVEPGWDLCADRARQLRLARHPDLGARLAGDLPVAAVRHRRDDGVLRVELHERPGLGLRRHHEREVLVEEHRNQERRGVIGVDRAVVDELADADPFDDRVVVALHQLALVDQLAGLVVVPARRGIVFPLDQAGGPRQLEHTGRRQLVVDLHLEACPR